MDVISAVCLTHSSRFGLLQRSIINFLEQTYKKKELLILTNEVGYADAIRTFLADPRLTELVNGANKKGRVVRLIPVSFRQAMEAILHAAVWAEGQWLACWDDDNLSHPERLEFQLSRTGKGRATYFSSSLYYFYDSEELFVTNYAQPGGRVADRCASASMLHHRTSFPLVDFMTRDVWSSHVADRTGGAGRHDLIEDRPEMFLVGSNGDNFRPAGHHRHLATALPAAWTREQLQAKSETVEQWLKSYRFNKSEVDVCGKDAQAFTVEGVPTWPEWLADVSPPQDWRRGIPNRLFQERVQEERSQARKVE